jgi:group I intron endonuclease
MNTNNILCQNETTTEQLKTFEPKIEMPLENIIPIISNPKESGKETLIERGIVYLITNLVNNKKYVGITTRTIKIRWNEHVQDALNSKRKRCVLRNAIVKYGRDNFKIESIAEFSNITEEELLDKESYYIEMYNTMVDDGEGYNLIRKSNQKLIMSEETKRKMSIAHSGENNHFYGKTHTEESLEKMGQPRPNTVGDKNHYYGSKHTKKIRKDISKKLKSYYTTHKHGRTGKTFTEESRKKMSLAQIGKKTGESSQHYDNRIFTFENRNSKETFIGTGYNFRIKYNIPSQQVSGLKIGRYKSYHGWIITKRP